MTTPNEFSDYYKTISNTELLRILDNPEDYQPPAVDAAKEEFSQRQLSETEIQTARLPLIAEQEQKERNKEKVKAIETKIRAEGNRFIDTINPVQPGIPSTEKTIRLFLIVFSGLWFYEIIVDFRTHWAYIKDLPRFPIDSILYLAPFVLLLIAVLTFWKRVTIGWYLFTIFLTHTLIVLLWTIVLSFLWEPSGNPIFDSLTSRPPVLTQIPQIIFFGAALFVICKRSIRGEFSISENKMIATIAVAGLLTFFFVYSIS